MEKNKFGNWREKVFVPYRTKGDFSIGVDGFGLIEVREKGLIILHQDVNFEQALKIFKNLIGEL